MDKWYYVFEGERKGPVEDAQIQELYSAGKLKDNDYVWKKGYDNWMKLVDTGEFNKAPARKPQLQSIPTPPQEPVQEQAEAIPSPISYMTPSFDGVDVNHKIYFIKTGADRGGKGAEYGPFSIAILKKLFSENRINGKTFCFTKGIETWTPLASFEGFQAVFNQVPTQIEDIDKRAFKRKPLIARMFIENNNQLFEGICRDVSIGGMQVLVDRFPGKAGERISINVHPENTDHHFTASGEIVRLLDGGLGFSFRFINLSDAAIKAINSYISGE
tara:strand:+ start:146596 stop:147414 length:819 start_codon:yes stop_codon:yes gene_type:complete